MNWTEILKALGDMAPELAMFIILAAIVFVGLIVLLRAGVPAMLEITHTISALGDSQVAMRKMWEGLLEASRQMADDMRKELEIDRAERERLSCRIQELERLIKEKDEQLAAQQLQLEAMRAEKNQAINDLTQAIDKLRADSKHKDEQIAKFKSDLATLSKNRETLELERNELKRRLEALEAQNKEA